MKVSELISLLEKENPEAVVMMYLSYIDDKVTTAGAVCEGWTDGESTFVYKDDADRVWADHHYLPAVILLASPDAYVCHQE